MLDQTRGSDYAIWLVAALIYACDAAKLLAPRELLLVETGHGRLSAMFSPNPYTLAGRVLVFAPLLRPDRGAFVARWGLQWVAGSALTNATCAMADLRASVGVARVLACAGFLLLFVVGPALTLFLGPNAAVVYTAAVVYPTTVMAIAWLWWQRRRLGLALSHSVWLSAEILICPPCLLNLVRKITAAHPLSIDGGQILSATASAEVTAEILGRLALRAEELVENETGDPSEAEELQRYRAKLRSRE